MSELIEPGRVGGPRFYKTSCLPCDLLRGRSLSFRFELRSRQQPILAQSIEFLICSDECATKSASNDTIIAKGSRPFLMLESMFPTGLEVYLTFPCCVPLVKSQVNDLGSMELLPVRSFFAEALSSLYVVSGEKTADQRARELMGDVPGSRSGANSTDGVSGTGSAEDHPIGEGIGSVSGIPDTVAELRSRRVRRFRR